MPVFSQADLLSGEAGDERPQSFLVDVAFMPYVVINGFNDANGAIVEQFDDDHGSNVYKVLLENAEQGIYYIDVVIDNKRHFTQKIVVFGARSK